MKKMLATYLNTLVLGALVLGSCSRPAAYFQQGSVVHYTTEPIPVTTPIAASIETPAGKDETLSMDGVPTTLAIRSTQAVDQMEAYVRSDNKLASNKRLSKRLARIKHLLTESTTAKSLAATPVEHKTTAVERLMLKKLDKKITKNLAPNQPQKPMINGGLLVGSLILALAGILLLLLTTGTVASIGLIAAIIGAVGIIFGLLAS